jgi:hypothetical protein
MKKIYAQEIFSTSEWFTEYRASVFLISNHFAKLSARPVCSNFAPGFRKSGRHLRSHLRDKRRNF